MDPTCVVFAFLLKFGSGKGARVFFKVLAGGAFAPVGPFACSSGEGKLLLLPQWTKSKWGPSHFPW